MRDSLVKRTGGLVPRDFDRREQHIESERAVYQPCLASGSIP